MAIQKRVIGTQHVFVGAVLDTGLMPDLGDLVEIGILKRDSVSIVKEEDTITDLEAQETGQIDISILSEVGAESFNFETRDFKSSNLLLAFGGSISGGKWVQSPQAYRGREKSAMFVGRAVNGLHSIIAFPKMKLTAAMSGEMVETESAGIMFTAKKLIPIVESTGVNMPPKYLYFKPQAPSFGVADDVENEFLFDYVPNFDLPADYEFSIDGGTSWNPVTTNPIAVTTAVPVGDLLVRVKANLTGDNQYVEGFALANTEPFTL